MDHSDGCPREETLDDPVGHPAVTGTETVADLLDVYAATGFGARNVSEAADILTAMFEDEDMTVAMGLAGAMVPAGMRTIIADLIRDGYIDVLVTTGATLTHDTIEAIGDGHYQGLDPHEGGDLDTRAHDEAMRAAEVDRIYDVYLPQEEFAVFEAHCRERVFPTLSETVTIEEVTHALGKANSEVSDDDRTAGLTAVAAECDVPIYAPAIQDSVFGLQLWLWSRTHDLTLDALGDMTTLDQHVGTPERQGAFVIGGGVPKNFVLQTMLVAPGAYDAAVQLTMDPPQTGGLSGASLDEARSWGKLAEDAENVSVYADATITLPLLVAGVRERLQGR